MRIESEIPVITYS